MTDAAIADATAGTPPMPAPLVPADGLPRLSLRRGDRSVLGIIERAARDPASTS